MVKYQSIRAKGEMIKAEDIVRNRFTGAIGTVTAVADDGYISVRYRTGEDLGGLQGAFEVAESADADVPGEASGKIADGVYNKVTLTGPAPYGGTCTSVTTDPKVAGLTGLGFVVTRSWTVTCRDGVPVRPAAEAQEIRTEEYWSDSRGRWVTATYRPEPGEWADDDDLRMAPGPAKRKAPGLSASGLKLPRGNVRSPETDGTTLTAAEACGWLRTRGGLSEDEAYTALGHASRHGSWSCPFSDDEYVITADAAFFAITT